MEGLLVFIQKLQWTPNEEENTDWSQKRDNFKWLFNVEFNLGILLFLYEIKEIWKDNFFFIIDIFVFTFFNILCIFKINISLKSGKQMK